MRKAKSCLMISFVVLSFLMVLMNFKTINSFFNQDNHSDMSENSAQFVETGRYDDNYGVPEKFQIINDIAYFATIDGLLIINLSNPSSPCFLSFYNSEGRVNDLEIIDNIAFLASGNSGLEIVDISELTNPSLISSCNLNTYAIGLFAQEDLIYIACSTFDLKIIDVSSLTSPYVIGELERPHDVTSGLQIHLYDFEREVIVKDGIALIADIENGIKIIDVHNPSNPYLININGNAKNPIDFCCQEDLLYVTESNYGMSIFNISNPMNPIKLSSYYTNETIGHDVCVIGDVAYIAQSHHDYIYIDDYIGGLEIVNVSNPQNPNQINKLLLTQSFYEVYTYNGLVFLNEDENFLTVVDPTNLIVPMISTYGFGGYSRCLTVKDDIAYIVGEGEGLEIIDVSNATQPIEIGQVEISQNVKDIVITDDFAFTTVYKKWERHLYGFDISNLSNPLILGKYNDADVTDFSTQGSNLYITGSQFCEYEIKNPYNLQLKSFIDLAGYFALEDNFAYIHTNNYELKIVDISQPYSMSVISTITFSNRFSFNVEANNGLVILTNPNLEFIDVTDPYNPVHLATYELSSYGSKKIVMNSNYAFIIVFENGYYIEMIDISNPRHPKKVDELKIDDISDIEYDGKYLYIVGGYEGLRIMKIEAITIQLSLNSIIFIFPVYVLIIIVFKERLKNKIL